MQAYTEARWLRKLARRWNNNEALLLGWFWWLVQMPKEPILRSPLRFQSHSCQWKFDGSQLYELRHHYFRQYRSEHANNFPVYHFGGLEWPNVHDDGFRFSSHCRHFLHSSRFLRCFFPAKRDSCRYHLKLQWYQECVKRNGPSLERVTRSKGKKSKWKGRRPINRRRIKSWFLSLFC